jgi:hypothetical protein
VDPVLDPLLLRQCGSVGNRTRTSGSVARISDHFTTVAVMVTFILIVSQAINFFSWSHASQVGGIHRLGTTTSQVLKVFSRRLLLRFWSVIRHSAVLYSNSGYGSIMFFRNVCMRL